jgi:hypothetical protein
LFVCLSLFVYIKQTNKRPELAPIRKGKPKPRATPKTRTSAEITDPLEFPVKRDEEASPASRVCQKRHRWRLLEHAMTLWKSRTIAEKQSESEAYRLDWGSEDVSSRHGHATIRRSKTRTSAENRRRLRARFGRCAKSHQYRKPKARTRTNTEGSDRKLVPLAKKRPSSALNSRTNTEKGMFVEPERAKTRTNTEEKSHQYGKKSHLWRKKSYQYRKSWRGSRRKSHQ